MDAVVITVGRLSDSDASVIASSMTRPGSEFQEEVKSREGSTTPIAIIRDAGDPVVAWAATHDWRGMQTLEGYTKEPFRRRGLARAAASLLAAAGHIDSQRTTAVFAPYCVEIARSVGCRDVRLFERRGGEWLENS
jgi:hypothetical protein